MWKPNIVLDTEVFCAALTRAYTCSQTLANESGFYVIVRQRCLLASERAGTVSKYVNCPFSNYQSSTIATDMPYLRWLSQCRDGKLLHWVSWAASSTN